MGKSPEEMDLFNALKDLDAKEKATPVNEKDVEAAEKAVVEAEKLVDEA
jgi:hypothetical protein